MLRSKRFTFAFALGASCYVGCGMLSTLVHLRFMHVHRLSEGEACEALALLADVSLALTTPILIRCVSPLR